MDARGKKRLEPHGQEVDHRWQTTKEGGSGKGEKRKRATKKHSMGENKASSLGHGPAKDEGCKAGSEVNFIDFEQGALIHDTTVSYNAKMCFDVEELLFVGLYVGC